jgi:hypothetical protein
MAHAQTVLGVLLMLLPFLGLALYIVRESDWTTALIVGGIVGGVLLCKTVAAWLITG